MNKRSVRQPNQYSLRYPIKRMRAYLYIPARRHDAWDSLDASRRRMNRHPPMI